MSDRNSKILYLHGRPMAHPMHTTLAKSVNSEFYPVDKYLRWQDANRSMTYRIISWIVNAFTYPVRKYDYILVDNLHFSPVIAKKFGLLGKRKVIVHLGSHTLYFMYAKRFSPLVGYLHRYALKNYDVLLCEGKMAEELVKKILGSQSPKKFVTYLGVPAERYSKLKNITPDLRSKTILIIANGPGEFREWYKGIDIMISAYTKVRKYDKELSLTILGEWDREIIDKNLSSVPEEIKKTIKFVGSVGQIEGYLANSSLCIHCTRGDAFPTSTLEVMAAGVVPLISNWTGTKEIIEVIDRRLVVTLEVEKIAESLSWFFSLRYDEKLKISNKCREVVKNFTESKAKEQYQETFSQINQSL